MWSGEKKDERKKGAKREELNPQSTLYVRVLQGCSSPQIYNIKCNVNWLENFQFVCTKTS